VPPPQQPLLLLMMTMMTTAMTTITNSYDNGSKRMHRHLLLPCEYR